MDFYVESVMQSEAFNYVIFITRHEYRKDFISAENKDESSDKFLFCFVFVELLFQSISELWTTPHYTWQIQSGEVEWEKEKQQL